MEVNDYEIAPGANLIGADLIGADLAGAVLDGANLARAKLSQAEANQFTTWPDGFDPESAGVIIG